MTDENWPPPWFGSVDNSNPDHFSDERGYIQDYLAGPIDAVTEIFTVEGAIRGNHVHAKTIQWVYITYGKLLVAWVEDDGVHTQVRTTGAFFKEPAGIPHAWKALETTRVLVMTRGPRSGTAYESDTQRLSVPILT